VSPELRTTPNDPLRPAPAPRTTKRQPASWMSAGRLRPRSPASRHLPCGVAHIPVRPLCGPAFLASTCFRARCSWPHRARAASGPSRSSWSTGARVAGSGTSSSASAGIPKARCTCSSRTAWALSGTPERSSGWCGQGGELEKNGKTKALGVRRGPFDLPRGERPARADKGGPLGKPIEPIELRERVAPTTGGVDPAEVGQGRPQSRTP
jgi:hypothetical protein